MKYTASFGKLNRDYAACCINAVNFPGMRAHNIYTGHVIMYSGITKIYSRKTVGHLFTKPVQIEGTTQKNFSQ